MYKIEQDEHGGFTLSRDGEVLVYYLTPTQAAAIMELLDENGIAYTNHTKL